MGFYNRMPYTDIHNLNLDWIINAMKKLEEDWEHYGATVSATAHAAEQPEVNVTGDFRSSVNFDFGIVRGATGPTGERGERGERGEKGEPGSGLEIKDTYPTLQALKQAHPVGAEGDAYLVGVSPDFFLYIWSTTSNDYENVGTLSSPSPAITEPLMDGTAEIGMENRYARADHRHPADDGKLDIKTNEGNTVEVYAFTGTEQNSIRVTDQPEAGKVVMYDEINGNVNTGEATADNNAINKATFDNALSDIENEISEKQDKLVAGSNIALFGGLSPLSNSYIGVRSIGNTVAEGGVNMFYVAGTAPEDTYLHLKTINNNSILGDGNISITAGGVTMTQLWSNASTGSVFAAQTVSISGLSGYKAIVISFKADTSATNPSTVILPYVSNASYFCCLATDHIRYRSAQVKSTGIVFGDGQYVGAYGTPTGSTNACIPLKIWGLK